MIDFVSLKFTAWPEMLAWPYLMLNGWLPYRDIAIAHNPLMLVVLSMFYKVFGLGVIQLKMFTWLLIAINTLLVYFISSKYYTKIKAIFSSVLYILFVIVFEGNGLWFDLALVPFSILIFHFLKSKRYYLTGIIFALGFLTKQTFVYFLIPVAIAIFKENKIKMKELGKLALGLITVFLIFTLYLVTNNLLSDYYNWAINFGIFYLPRAGGQISLPSVSEFLFGLSPFLVLIFNLELLPFALVGLMGVYPRWEIFHFQPALPFLVIALANTILTNKRKYFSVVIGFVTLAYVFVGISRQIGNETRFVSLSDIKVVDDIKKINPDSIYVVNYWDNLYALSNELPSTKPLIPYIPWYLSYDGNNKKILNSLKVNTPEVLIIGEIDKIDWLELKEFVGKYYTCNLPEEKVELCIKN